MTPQQEALARKIVANLAHRYRLARKCANLARDKDHPTAIFRWQYEAMENEAWNALQASKRILYGYEL